MMTMHSPRSCLWFAVCGGLSLALSVALAETQAKEQPSISWSEPASLAARSLLLDVVKVGTRILAVGDRGHALYSEDEGATWRQTRVPTRSMLTAVTAVRGGRLWAVGHDAVIVHSQDGGRSWARQFFAPEDETPLLDVWFENSVHGLAVGAYGSILETRDGGGSWKRRTIDEEEPHLNAIVESDDGTLYIAAEFGLVFRSRDRGQTWDRLDTSYGGSLFGALCLSDGGLLAFGLRGHVFRSDDEGESWKEVETTSTASLMAGLQRADGTIILVGLSGTLLVGSEGREGFRVVNRADRNGIAALTELGPEQLLLVGEAGVCGVGDSLTAACARGKGAGGS